MGIQDSKRITALKREQLFDWILSHAAGVSVGWASVGEIEHLNIRGATLLAMRRAVEGLFGEGGAFESALLAIDGIDRVPGVPFSQIPVPGGDSRVLTIAAASIIAKVSRDRVMRDLDHEFPEYRFREHKGYGTSAHRDALLRLGLSPHHRPRFCRKTLNPDLH